MSKLYKIVISSVLVISFAISTLYVGAASDSSVDQFQFNIPDNGSFLSNQSFVGIDSFDYKIYPENELDDYISGICVKSEISSINNYIYNVPNIKVKEDSVIMMSCNLVIPVSVYSVSFIIFFTDGTNQKIEKFVTNFPVLDKAVGFIGNGLISGLHFSTPDRYVLNGNVHVSYRNFNYSFLNEYNSGSQYIGKTINCFSITLGGAENTAKFLQMQLPLNFKVSQPQDTTTKGLFGWFSSTWLGQAFNSIVTGIKNNNNSLFGWFSSTWLGNAFGNIISSITSSIQSFFSNPLQFFKDRLSDIKDAFQWFSDTKFGNWFSGVVSGIGSHISDFFTDPIGNISNFLSSIWNDITGIFSSISNRLSDNWIVQLISLKGKFSELATGTTTAVFNASSYNNPSGDTSSDIDNSSSVDSTESESNESISENSNTSLRQGTGNNNTFSVDRDYYNNLYGLEHDTE